MNTSDETKPEGMMVSRVTKAWYVLCRSGELRQKPLSRTLFSQPIVLFRQKNGAPGALLDRCAHRNVPLSLGRVVPEGILSRIALNFAALAPMAAISSSV